MSLVLLVSYGDNEVLNSLQRSVPSPQHYSATERFSCLSLETRTAVTGSKSSKPSRKESGAALDSVNGDICPLTCAVPNFLHNMVAHIFF